MGPTRHDTRTTRCNPEISWRTNAEARTHADGLPRNEVYRIGYTFLLNSLSNGAGLIG